MTTTAAGGQTATTTTTTTRRDVGEERDEKALNKTRSRQKTRWERQRGISDISSKEVLDGQIGNLEAHLRIN